jgi:hypothetical protein
LENLIQAEKSYGSKNVDGTWSGVVGKVASGHADLGLNMFALSTERMDVIHFLNHIETYR